MSEGPNSRGVRRARRYLGHASRTALKPILSRREQLAAASAERIAGGGHWVHLRPGFPPSADERPRYGYGRPPHERLRGILARGDNDYRQVLEGFGAYREQLNAIPLRKPGPAQAFWSNMSLFGIDGVALYCYVRQLTPRRYLEIGSGNSTLFVDRARRDGSIDMEVISIDPGPRFEIDSVCDRVIRAPLETTDLGVFSELREGDIVFMDGTHRVFTNSDATVFFLDVLPELPPGVLVGIHDIHLPDDYLPQHTDHYYSEQYLLACYLLAESSWIRPSLPCWYLAAQPELQPLAESLLPDAALALPGRDARGVTFWLTTQPRGPVWPVQPADRPEA